MRHQHSPHYMANVPHSSTVGSRHDPENLFTHTFTKQENPEFRTERKSLANILCS